MKRVKILEVAISEWRGGTLFAILQQDTKYLPRDTGNYTESVKSLHHPEVNLDGSVYLRGEVHKKDLYASLSNECSKGTIINNLKELAQLHTTPQPEIDLTTPGLVTGDVKVLAYRASRDEWLPRYLLSVRDDGSFMCWDSGRKGIEHSYNTFRTSAHPKIKIHPQEDPNITIEEQGGDTIVTIYKDVE